MSIALRFPEFTVQVSQLAEKIAKILDGGDVDSPKEAEVGDAEALKVKLRETARLLENLEQDMAAGLLDGAMVFTYGESTDETLKTIRQAVDAFDYNSALAGIHACLAALDRP